MRNVRVCAAVLAAAAVCFLSVPASAAGAGEIASMSAGANALVWQPAVAYEQMVLTVSGPDGVFSLEFDGATAPSLSLYDQAGFPLADGSYNWELRAAPVVSPAVRAEMARARETGDESGIRALRQAGELPQEPMVLSGHFRVHEGAFVRPDLDEAETRGPRSSSAPVRSMHAPDFVINDDLIVNGGSSSICVGFDCVNNEPFGFDTIRLKENNTRILFMDTSVGTFPTRDWMLVANDSASGGQSRFSIEDVDGARIPFTVEAAAPTNSIYADSTGRIGFRTSTPVLDLHINTSNTPGIRLEQNNSGGFAAQTWDIAGNEANFFVRDVTNGSTLPFRIEPGTASSTLYLDSQERVGIGTNAPEAPLEVQTSNSGLLMQLEGSGDIFFRELNTASGQFVDFNLIGNEFRINFGTGGAGPELRLDNNGNLIITGSYTPDYVFEPDYPLLTLDELDSFIEENKHLPNIPSDAEVKATRQVNVVEFQMRLLEKIEELTLYTLQQHETISVLQAEVAELKEAAEAN